jgi:non-specific serine/threonine protein kinase
MTLLSKFEFSYKEGKPFLKVLDPSIKRVVGPSSSSAAAPSSSIPNHCQQPAGHRFSCFPVCLPKLGIVINLNAKGLSPFYRIDAIQANADEALTKYIWVNQKNWT